MGRSVSAVLAAVLLGCNAGPGAAVDSKPHPGSQAPIATRPLPLGPDATGLAAWSGFHAPARLVIRSQAEWDAAWAIVQEPTSTKTAAPHVDFAAEMVLLAALGDRSSGGYAVGFSDVTATGTVIEAGVLETRPGAGCAQITVITAPVAAIAVPRSDLPVEFVDRVLTRNCE